MREGSRREDVARERGAASGEVRKIELGDAGAIHAMIAALGAGLAARDLDAEHRYAATCLRQHLSARRQRVAEASVEPRSHGELASLADDLAGALARAARLEDAVANAVAGGGSLDDYESAALSRRLREIVGLLATVTGRLREIELSSVARDRGASSP
jgi:hypothetical protein